jgi:glycosyltransferase involved in cell wall biosynthesis
MIVKDEGAIIERCLRSFVGHIDAYVICDTGSSDDTVAKVHQVLDAAGVPGTVVTVPFLNFEQARNDALQAAKDSHLEFDHVLFCDADMELCVDDPLWRDTVSAPVLGVMQRTETGFQYPNVRLVRRTQPARYVGVTHEYIDTDGVAPLPFDGIHFVDHTNGASRAVKYDRDIALLLVALADGPENTRSVFYLANSYFDSGRNAEALHWYRRRLMMAGYEDERFISMYRIGVCYRRMGDDALLLHQMLMTFDRYPHRAEPLHVAALRAQQLGHHRMAYEIAKMGADLAAPTHALFVESDVYNWRLDDIMAVSLYWLGRWDEAARLNDDVLPEAPASEQERIRKNLMLCRQKISERTDGMARSETISPPSATDRA